MREGYTRPVIEVCLEKKEYHSCRRASIGLRFAACHAGYIPQRIEIMIPKLTPSTTDIMLDTVKRYSVVLSIRALIAYPPRILRIPPIRLPITPIMAAS